MSNDNIIHLLPDSVCNQIAAGEVIQRPSSVVKELLENSVDAKSTEIKVVIEDYGKTLIQVIDNGIGMSEVDARMSLEKHATSKIRNSDDLFKINTMGFRGEAIASIVSVSQSEIITKTANSKLGTKIVVENSDVKSQEPMVCVQGTIFNVRNLFFNTPVRRMFLKTPQNELMHIISEFKYIALSRPDISFSLKHNKQELYHLSSGTLLERIANIFGDIYKKKLIQCTNEINSLATINGFIGNPSCARKTKNEQFIFINGRFVRHQYLQYVIKSAYGNTITNDKHPFFVLFIDINPSNVDVNIHPSKTEVKIKNEELIGTYIGNILKRLLATYEMPQIDFNCDNKIILDQGKYNSLQYNPIKDHKTSISSDNSCKKNDNKIAIESKTINYEEHINPRIIQFKASYILTTVKSGIMIIDQHRAHTKILYDKYLKMYNQKNINAQNLLFPETIDVCVDDYNTLEVNQDKIKKLGLLLEFKDKNQISIIGYPSWFNVKSSNDILEPFIEQIKTDGDHVYERLSLSLAQRNSIRYNELLTTNEMETLIGQLFSYEMAQYTPNGEKIWHIIHHDEIEKMF